MIRSLPAALIAIAMSMALPAFGQENPPRQPEAASSPAEPAPAPAQAEPEPPNDRGRYIFNKVEGGVLRLDSHNGDVSLCSPHSLGWACQSVPEDRAALEKVIARLGDRAAAFSKQIAELRDQNAALSKELADLRNPPPPPRPPETVPPSASNETGKLKLPSEEDIERARAFIEQVWRRLVEMISNLQKDMVRKG